MDLREIDHFFTTMETIVIGAKAVGRRLSLELGTNFNPLEYMRTDELGLSQLIANLLDPYGSHGQGSIFLELFMKECDFVIEPYHTLEDARVITEMAFGDGRIDIIVQFSAGVLMAIENKPYAIEQNDQLDRYAKYLNRHQFEESLLVYVPGYSRSSRSLTAETKTAWTSDKKRYAEVVYNSEEEEASLCAWLRKCEKAATAPKLRLFLADFADWINDSFPELSPAKEET